MPSFFVFFIVIIVIHCYNDNRIKALKGELTMRVISGRARGTKLLGPEGLETRPTSDRIKESLFNIIGIDIQDTCFLDIFSGSGGIGIEALSRGASQAVFIDQSKEAHKVIQANLLKTRFTQEAVLLKMPVREALRKLGLEGKKFHIIFMDPPYHQDLVGESVELIIKNDLLLPQGYIIIERPTDYTMKDYKEFRVWKEKKYKMTTMSFLKGV